jgi:hypothetical protein
MKMNFKIYQNYSISDDDLKSEKRLNETKINDQKMNLSQTSKFLSGE